MSITSYTLKIKELCDSLSSISVNVEDDEMVQICLGGLAPRFGAMRTAVLTRENPPYFDLQFMLLVEENHVRTRSNASEDYMLYSEEEYADKQEVDSAKDKVAEVRLMKTTPNFDKNAEIIEERSEEEGVSIPGLS